MRPARSRLVACLSLLLAAPAAAQFGGCPVPLQAEVLGPGTQGELGPLELRSETLPAVGGSFRLRVSGALPLAHGCLLSSQVEAFQVVPEVGGFWYVGVPFWLKPFDFDAGGESPALLEMIAAPPALCGLTFVLQALCEDDGAPLGLVLSNPLRLTFGTAPELAPTLDPLDSPTTALTAVVSGKGLFVGDVVLVEGGAAAATGSVAADGSFAVTVPLAPDTIHTLFVRELFVGGGESAPAVLGVVQDSSPPELAIDFPTSGSVVGTPTTHVAGRVGDALSGFLGLEVEVNGVQAVVDVGIGSNGTFDAADVPLSTNGPTELVATARDVLGNEVTTSAQVTFESPVGFTLTALSGDEQVGPAAAELVQPLEVYAAKPDGSPFAGKLVRFAVSKSDGLLAGAQAGDGVRVLGRFTDTAGIARAWWTLGVDAGCGNQRVAVTAAGLDGTAAFCATATAGAPDRIHVSSGGMQWGAPGAALAEPLGVWVSDGRNGIAGVPVTFTVREGSGMLADPAVASALVVTVPTDATGHATTAWTLGGLAGNQVVEATFAGNPSAKARFVAYAAPVDPAGTSFTATVLDNSGQPLAGVHCTLHFEDGAEFESTTDAGGRCSFGGLPTGLADLHVEGATATAAGGVPLDPASVCFPALHFRPFLHAGVANGLPQPVFLPRLDPANDVVFDGTEDVVLRAVGLEGFELVVAAGTEVVLTDGTIASPATPVTLSVNQVHLDEIPMPLPDGARPPFAWTLQPGGAHFDPPVQVRYPNSAGLAPGAVGYLLSFDHSTNRFEVVSNGTVDEDGAQLVSDAGDGIEVAGWGGACPPYPTPGDVEKCGEGTCTDNGTLSPFGVQVNNQAVKLGDFVCFSVEHVVDSGGEELIACEDSAIAQVVPPDESLVYQAVITAPDGSQSNASDPLVGLLAEQTGIYSVLFGISADRPCAPQQILPEGQVTVLDGEIGEPLSAAFGYDDFCEPFCDPFEPWISLENEPTLGQALPISLEPLDAFALTEVNVFDEALIDVFVEAPGGVPTDLDIFATGNKTGVTFVDWAIRPVGQTPICEPTSDLVLGSVNVVVYDRKVLKVAYQVIHEDNDDDQLIEPGMGKPDTVCVRSVLGGAPATIPGGDDHVVGDTILTGPNGVCESEVTSILDLQVIPIGQGEPDAVCVGSGTNQIGDSSPLGDDVSVSPDGLVLTGPNGICDTPAEDQDQLAPPGPTEQALEGFLNDVFEQALVEIELTELPPIEVAFDVNWDLELSLDDQERILIEAAANEANDLSGFDKIAFLVPEVGALDGFIAGFATIGGTYGYSASGASPSAMQVVAHELGHNLGLVHAEGDDENVMFPVAGVTHTKLRKDQWDKLQGVE